jgi:hypothetical protein
MTLDSNQILIISEQLEKENISEFIETLILQYASDVNRTSRLLSLIPKIAENQLKITKNEVIEHSFATNLLIGATDKNKKIDFPTLLYVAKVCFPSGNCNGASQVGERFFNKFIDAIRAKKEFDYQSKKDWDFICNIAQCESWMHSVIKQNINNGLENNTCTD